MDVTFIQQSPAVSAEFEGDENFQIFLDVSAALFAPTTLFSGQVL